MHDLAFFWADLVLVGTLRADFTRVGADDAPKCPDWARCALRLAELLYGPRDRRWWSVKVHQTSFSSAFTSGVLPSPISTLMIPLLRGSTSLWRKGSGDLRR